MKTATASLLGTSPYAGSRNHETPHLPKETAESYEERTWRDRCHCTADGHVFIPPMAFKFSIASAAKQLSIQIPGRGKATYTKFFENGVQVLEGPVLDATRDTVRRQRVFANSDGRRGSGKRVWRFFPTVDQWRGVVSYHILAGEITDEIFERVLLQSGVFVGVGQFRPENGGTNGRFAVEKIVWSK